MTNLALNQFLRNEIERLGIPSRKVLESPQGERVCINGEWKISLCSNNYLGLANHPAVNEAAVQAIKQYGAGSGAARLLSGSTLIHEELEHELAEFKGTESTIVFNSGFTTNSGVIPALLRGEGNAVFSDELNHGSLVDGCRLSRAEKYIYHHGDVDHLEKLLRNAGHCKKRMIVTDTVFSMNGDIAPLTEIVQLCEQYDVFLMVDEAHATGILGKHARGAVESLGLEGRVDILMGTLGKALGSVGGYIAGTKELIAYLTQSTRPFLLTTSLPASCMAAALAAIRVIQDDPGLKDKLWYNTNFFRNGLQELGFNTMNSKTPIVPVLIGDDELAQRSGQRLYEEGVYVTKIGTPLVPAGTSRLRTIISAVHSEQVLKEALTVFESVGHELGII